MAKKASTAKIILIIYLLFLHITAGYLLYDKFKRPLIAVDESKKEIPVVELQAPVEIPAEQPSASNTVSPSSTDSVTPAPAASPQSQENNANAANLAVKNDSHPEADTGKLMIPVSGIKKSQLTDTFNDARSEGRVHNAIDIMAKGGTPVVAAADGEIAKFFDSKLGGITIYQYSVDKKLVYYYAHLQKRADNLSEHTFVKQGTVIAYVGDTGNAGTGNFHLHFGISSLNDPKKYWDGTDINPFPILKNGIEAP